MLTPGIDRVLIVPDATESKTDAGLILHYSKKQNPTTGVIHSIGPGDESSMEGISVGDRVAFRDMAGSEFKFDGQTYYCLFYSEILAVLPEEQP